MSSKTSSESDADDSNSQICNTCFVRKDLTEFCKMKRSENGAYNPTCKSCVKKKVKCPNHKCSKCKELKPISEFNNTCRVCNSCRNDYEVERNNITEKFCSKCDKLNPIENFYNNKNCLDGKGSWCKSCSCMNSNYFNSCFLKFSQFPI